MYSRGISGQVLFTIGFSILMMSVPAVSNSVEGMTTSMQTVVFLMTSQVGCTLGTVWGM